MRPARKSPLVLLAALAAPPPNIVFILADDLGYGDVGAYGQKKIETPRLDRMAAEGIRFTQVYAGSTVCAPSRSVLMTGKHTGHTRVRGNARVPLRPEDVTVAELLKARGYRTGLFGKWGLGEIGTSGAPLRKGFDEQYGYVNQRHAHNYYPSFLWRNEEKVPLRNRVPDEDKEHAGVATVRADYSHDLIADEALKFMERSASAGTPFFLYAAFTLPHANNEAKERGMEVPDLGPYEDRPWPEAEKARAAMVSRLDRDVGRILDLLAKLDLDKRTLVVFSSDNGPHKEGGTSPEFLDANGPLRGIKRDLYEGGIRVPTIARWPGRVPAGRTSDEIWTFADVLPTLAAIAGAKAPPGLDGANVMPALLGKKLPGPDRFLYWEFHERGFHQAVRWGRWKAVIPSGQPVELYDLAADLGETRDLAAAQPKVVARIKRYLAGARTESAEFPVTARAN